MNNIFTKIPYMLEKNIDLMLVTIVAEEGSSPRGTGSMMLVAPEGRLLGTVGGGNVEYVAERTAKELIASRSSELREFALQAQAPNSVGMICGGDVKVWFQFIDHADPAWGELCKAVTDRIAARQRGFLIQHLDGGLPELADAADPDTLHRFSQALPVGERALVFGGGHIAYALVPLLATVGFRVTVMDARPEYASAERFPSAERVICGDFTRIADYLTPDAEDFCVVMSNAHAHDYEIQEQLLRGPYAYVGVVGSAKKTAAVNEKLRAAGISEAAIASVHTPIGTKIRAVTPEEIAVSIAGEMILVRAERRDPQNDEQHGCPMHQG